MATTKKTEPTDAEVKAAEEAAAAEAKAAEEAAAAAAAAEDDQADDVDDVDEFEIERTTAKVGDTLKLGGNCIVVAPTGTATSARTSYTFRSGAGTYLVRDTDTGELLAEVEVQ